MKKLLTLLSVITPMFFVSCSTGTLNEPGTTNVLRGKSYSYRGSALIRFSFKKNNSVIYQWNNKERSDLNYAITSESTFNIRVNGNEKIWGEGVIENNGEEYILLSNFVGDTLYLE